jgi:hypothetical protein
MALSITGAAAMAGGDDWADLDRAVAELTASLDQAPQGPRVSGYIISQYVASSDITAGGGDISGFRLPNARVAVEGSVGNYDYKVQYNFADNTIKDIWARFVIADGVNGMLGNYKSPVLLDGLTSTSKLFFFDRSVTSKMWSGRDLGFQLYGGFDEDTVDWFISMQNGADGTADDYLFTGRAQFNLFGDVFKDQRFKGVEGAQNGTEDVSGTFAVSAFDDGGVEDGNGFAAEAHLKTNVYSIGAEMLDLGDGVSGATDPEGDALNGFVNNYYALGDFAGLSLEDNSTPFSIQGTYMISASEGNITGWEVGGRYQDFDDTANDTIMEIGLRRYLNGHGLKWGVFYLTTDSDVVENEFDLFGVDFVVAF